MSRRATLAGLGVVAAGVLAVSAAAGGRESSSAGSSGAGAGGRAAPQAAAPAVRLLRLGTFSSPTYLAAPPGERRRRFVVERAGRIRVVRDGRVLARPFLDIRARVSTVGESGLLSMAFARDYRSSRRFYVYYVDREGAIRIDGYRRSPASADRAQPGSRRVVIRQPHLRPNHKGGQLQVGPDGRLYAGLGDGGGGGDPDRNAQDLGRLPGKLLRLDPVGAGRRRYRVPRDNPLVGRPGRDELYAWGLRNPWRFSFDRAAGDLTVADVGQDAVEEVDFVPGPRRRGRAPPGGHNFGWPVFEGRRRFGAGRLARHTRPVLERTRGQGACGIVGGYVIRDRSLGRALQGRYVYGDLCDSRLRSARLRRPRALADRPLGVRVPGLVSFGEDGVGRVHAVSLAGPVFRVARARPD